MIRLENECVCCGLPCLGNSCPNRNVPHCYCDDCGDEFAPEDLRLYQGWHLCRDCLADRFPEVRVYD